jgi:anti-sigma-K factor RskA
MPQDEHSLLRENIPAYALGTLDAEDKAALEAHLQSCEACRTELVDYLAISENLLAAIPPRQPSAALRKRLQSQLPSAQKQARPRFTLSFSQFAMGAALALLLLMSVFAFVQMRAIQSQQASLQQQLKQSQFALSMLAYPDTQSIPIPGESGSNLSGSVLLDRDRNTIALVMWRLPELSQDKTYQIWLIEPDGHRVSAGLFRPQPDASYITQPVFAKPGISSFVGVGVTVEPAGGSDQPTGPRVFKVDF